MRQRYLPIIEAGKNKILGLYDLGTDRILDGSETDMDVPHSNSEDSNVNLVHVVRSDSTLRPVNLEYMAAVFTNEQVDVKAYEGFSSFIDVNDAKPRSNWLRHNGSAVYDVNERIVQGLMYRNGFADDPNGEDVEDLPDDEGDENYVKLPVLTMIGESVNAPYWLSFPIVRGYETSPGADFIRVVCTWNGESVPEPGIGSFTLDWDVTETVGEGNGLEFQSKQIRPQAEGNQLHFYVVRFSEDWQTIAEVWPVFASSDGMIGPERTDLEPQYKEYGQPSFSTQDEEWHVEFTSPSDFFSPDGDPVSVVYEWFVNNVSRGTSVPWNDRTVAKADITGISAGDVVYMTATASNTNGSTQVTSQERTIQAGDLV